MPGNQLIVDSGVEAITSAVPYERKQTIQHVQNKQNSEYDYKT